MVQLKLADGILDNCILDEERKRAVQARLRVEVERVATMVGLDHSVVANSDGFPFPEVEIRYSPGGAGAWDSSEGAVLMECNTLVDSEKFQTILFHELVHAMGDVRSAGGVMDGEYLVNEIRAHMKTVSEPGIDYIKFMSKPGQLYSATNALSSATSRSSQESIQGRGIKSYLDRNQDQKYLMEKTLLERSEVSKLIAESRCCSNVPLLQDRFENVRFIQRELGIDKMLRDLDRALLAAEQSYRTYGTYGDLGRVESIWRSYVDHLSPILKS